MYPFQKSSDPHPRHELDSNGIITNRWVPARAPCTLKELEDLYASLPEKKSDKYLGQLDEFSRAVGQSIDAYLIEDSDESVVAVKKIISESKTWSISVYTGTQIHHILSVNPKLAAGPEDVGYFEKYRDHMSSFNKEKKLITTIAERFL